MAALARAAALVAFRRCRSSNQFVSVHASFATATPAAAPVPRSVHKILQDIGCMLEERPASPSELAACLSSIVTSAVQGAARSRVNGAATLSAGTGDGIELDRYAWNAISSGIVRDRHTVLLFQSVAYQLQSGMSGAPSHASLLHLATVGTNVRSEPSRWDLATLAGTAESVLPITLRARVYVDSILDGVSLPGHTATVPPPSAISLERARAVAESGAHILESCATLAAGQLRATSRTHRHVLCSALSSASTVCASLMHAAMPGSAVLLLLDALAEAAAQLSVDCEAVLRDDSCVRSLVHAACLLSHSNALPPPDTGVTGTRGRYTSAVRSVLRSIGSLLLQVGPGGVGVNSMCEGDRARLVAAVAFHASMLCTGTIGGSDGDASLLSGLARAATATPGETPSSGWDEALQALPPSALLALAEVVSTAAVRLREDEPAVPETGLRALLVAALQALSTRLTEYESTYLQRTLGGQLLEAACAQAGLPLRGGAGMTQPDAFQVTACVPPPDPSSLPFAVMQRRECGVYTLATRSQAAGSFLHTIGLTDPSGGGEGVGRLNTGVGDALSLTPAAPLATCRPPAVPLPPYTARRGGLETHAVLCRWAHTRLSPAELVRAAELAGSNLQPSPSPSSTLPGACVDLLMRIGDTAVAHALGGESSCGQEVGTASAFAGAGVSHRALFMALSRRLVARASVHPSRLHSVGTGTLVRALACLSTAWEWDQDAFAVVIRELRKRGGRGSAPVQVPVRAGGFLRSLVSGLVGRLGSGDSSSPPPSPPLSTDLSLASAPEWGWSNGLDLPAEGEGQGAGLTAPVNIADVRAVLAALHVGAGATFGPRFAPLLHHALLPMLAKQPSGSCAGGLAPQLFASGIPAPVLQGDASMLPLAREVVACMPTRCSDSAAGRHTENVSVDMRDVLRWTTALLAVHIRPASELVIGAGAGELDRQQHRPRAAAPVPLEVGAPDGIHVWYWLQVGEEGDGEDIGSAPLASLSLPLALPAHGLLIDIIPACAALPSPCHATRSRHRGVPPGTPGTEAQRVAVPTLGAMWRAAVLHSASRAGGGGAHARSPRHTEEEEGASRAWGGVPGSGWTVAHIPLAAIIRAIVSAGQVKGTPVVSPATPPTAHLYGQAPPHLPLQSWEVHVLSRLPEGMLRPATARAVRLALS